MRCDKRWFVRKDHTVNCWCFDLGNLIQWNNSFPWWFLCARYLTHKAQVFVLSAVSPEKMHLILNNVKKVLKVSCLVLTVLCWLYIVANWKFIIPFLAARRFCFITWLRRRWFCSSEYGNLITCFTKYGNHPFVLLFT